MLAAYLADPGFRPEAFERTRAAYLAEIPQLEATPEGVLAPYAPEPDARRRSALGFSGQGRTAGKRPESPADLAQAARFPADRSKSPSSATYPCRRGHPRTAGTFGALPQRSDAAVPADALDVRFPPPTAQPVMRTHTGRTDQAGAGAAVSIGDLLSDLPRARAADIAAEVFQNRLLDQFRIAEGATYSPQGEASLSDTLPGFGFAYLYVETTPAKVDRFFELVSKIAVDLQTGEVTPDELARAKEPTIERVRKQQQTNEYWLSNLDGVQTDPRRLELLRTSVSGYEAVTAKDVRTLASAYFDADKFWKFEVLPEVTGAAR